MTICFYQTVYAKVEGSAAAPTAGLHFTDEILEKVKPILEQQGYAPSFNLIIPLSCKSKRALASFLMEQLFPLNKEKL